MTVSFECLYKLIKSMHRNESFENLFNGKIYITKDYVCGLLAYNYKYITIKIHLFYNKFI